MRVGTTVLTRWADGPSGQVSRLSVGPPSDASLAGESSEVLLEVHMSTLENL